MNRVENLKEIINDNKQTLLVSEIDLEYYKDKKNKAKKNKVKTEEEKETKKALIEDIDNNIERVEQKIKTLEKWLKIARNRLKKEK
jgi:hypothetical protein